MLYVKRVPWSEFYDEVGPKAERLESDYVFMPGLGLGETYLYIRCDYQGNINWYTAKVYSLTELIERDDVQIIQ